MKLTIFEWIFQGYSQRYIRSRDFEYPCAYSSGSPRRPGCRYYHAGGAIRCYGTSSFTTIYL